MLSPVSIKQIQTHNTQGTNGVVEALPLQETTVGGNMADLALDAYFLAHLAGHLPSAPCRI